MSCVPGDNLLRSSLAQHRNDAETCVIRCICTNKTLRQVSADMGMLHLHIHRHVNTCTKTTEIYIDTCAQLPTNTRHTQTDSDKHTHSYTGHFGHIRCATTTAQLQPRPQRIVQSATQEAQSSSRWPYPGESQHHGLLLVLFSLGRYSYFCHARNDLATGSVTTNFGISGEGAVRSNEDAKARVRCHLHPLQTSCEERGGTVEKGQDRNRERNVQVGDKVVCLSVLTCLLPHATSGRWSAWEFRGREARQLRVPRL